MYRNLGIGSWIARRARMGSARPALVFEDREISYGTLADRIDRLASALRRMGVDKGDRVAFVGANEPAALEILFASSVLGASWVPIHPAFDEGAMATIFASSSPKVVVVDRDREERVRRHCKNTVVLLSAGASSAGTRSLDDVIAETSGDNLDLEVGLDDTCLIAFSSGTTGPNKGVRLTHGNLHWNAINILTCLDILSDDAILTSAPLYRMGGLGFTLAVLLKGGTCVIQGRPDALESMHLIAERHVTVWFDSVGALQAASRSSFFADAELGSLRLCLTGGTSVPRSLVSDFGRRGLCLQPGYGLTEAAPLALILDRSDVSSHADAAGRPPLFCAVRVVDEQLRELAPGRVGELMVCGPNVMPGYWSAPEASERALVDGWLRTGDAALRDEDGLFTIVGRVVDALVIDGRVFHPGLVERAVRDLDGVSDCALVQHSAEAMPTAFIECDSLDGRVGDSRAEAVAVLRCTLDAEIDIQFVSALPRNPNGKVVRERLRARAELDPVHQPCA